MECNNCGGAVEMIEPYATETEIGGAFIERYQCVGCDGIGKISGTVGEPAGSWQRRGILNNEH